jgi:hypothetical protein
MNVHIGRAIEGDTTHLTTSTMICDVGRLVTKVDSDTTACPLENGPNMPCKRMSDRS